MRLLHIVLLPLALGCNVGNEGERCNPSLTHDECSAGLSCLQPVDCPESYCCPTTRVSRDPFCQAGCNGGRGSICAAGGDADCPAEASGDSVDGGAGVDE
jgi:hypothetical protein